MKWLVALAAFVLSTAGCQRAKQPEEVAEEVARQLATRVRVLDKSKSPPELPFPKNPPRYVDPQKIKTESAKITSLKIQEIERGSGPMIEPGLNVSVHYVGLLPDGYVFDTSYKNDAQPFTFKYDPAKPAVIKGWIQGLKGMRVGGRRKLIIPASLAYGANPPLGLAVPPNSALIFDVTLMFVSKI